MSRFQRTMSLVILSAVASLVLLQSPKLHQSFSVIAGEQSTKPAGFANDKLIPRAVE